MDGLEAQPIPGTEGGTTPFFSPDGQWVGFSAGGKLKKILLSGGAPVTLAGDVAPAGVIGASWSSQGMIAFAPRGNGPILQVSDSGGNPQPLTRLEKGEASDVLPLFLPGSKALLFLYSIALTPTSSSATLAAQSLRTDERRDLLQVRGPTNLSNCHVSTPSMAGTAAPESTSRWGSKGTAIRFAPCS